MYPVNDGKFNKTARMTVTLNVSYSPKDTSAYISPTPSLVSLGSWVNLTCSSRANPPITHFTWFKSSTEGPMNVSDGDLYSFNVTRDSDAGVYYCVASNNLGNQTSSEIHLTIKENPDGSEAFEAIVGGIIGIILLVCLAVSVWCLRSTHLPPLQIQSQIGEEPNNRAEEEIQYGEIDFSRQEPKQCPDRGRYQDTEINIPQVTQTRDFPEDIYAQRFPLIAESFMVSVDY
ncbi:cell adhesion molecule 3-like [Polymixia lowei]